MVVSFYPLIYVNNLQNHILYEIWYGIIVMCMYMASLKDIQFSMTYRNINAHFLTQMYFIVMVYFNQIQFRGRQWYVQNTEAGKKCRQFANEMFNEFAILKTDVFW